MNEARAQLEEGVASLGLQASTAALDCFDRYLRELLEWRGRLNLTGAKNAGEIVGLHFIDSLLPLAVHPFPPDCRVIDVGSGAGFPGVPLRLMRPDLRFTLVEASRRRVAFLEHVQSVLHLEDVEIVWARAEILARRPEHREAFGAAVERATARVAAAAELSLPFVAVGGAAILLKGPRVSGETGAAAALISRLGGVIESSGECALPTTKHRRVTIVVRKVQATPEGFPRRSSRLGLPI